MRHRLRGLTGAVLGALASALVLVTAAGANHAGVFEIGHFNTTPSGGTNGLTCTGTAGPCFESTNDTTTTTNPGTTAIRGRHTATSGRGTGVWGTTTSSDSIFSFGVRGDAAAGMGVSGMATSGIGVIGGHNDTTGTNPGVRGFTISNDGGAAGVNGYAQGTSSGAIGVLGNADNGVGVVGAGPVGVLGVSAGPLAGWFLGDVYVQGTLFKNSGAFRIDHPLDATKYLQHSFVESPDMMNVYNGNVRTDRRGFATVRLPRYFQALNRDFRYQLTVVGTRGWRARVVRKIAGNRFTIQTDAPRALVSWQVTGVREDAYANAHRIRPEVAKSAADRTPSAQVERQLKALARR
jgi:hypothetical protein